MNTPCPELLTGLGYACGRPIDTAAGMGLCSFHTQLAGGKSRQKNEDVPHERRPGVLAKPGAALCGCGEPAYARGMCYGCYHLEYRQRRREQGNPLVRASRGAR